ncbi:hypothetical protein [Pseudoduganella aquatica]|uniref:Uncharacterized protein n=1 Tax=Pseudoduganella aquatica TaxID=2660641 RepID=A0A7X4H9J4_9BURK|nr:hypothetical protein [Pseudoduganella aquatica]MYN06245.1 hypothetical protein [Pseudoduganella aquatica]
MDKSDDERQLLILSVLSFEEGANQSAVVAQVVRALQQLAVHFRPLMGSSGFFALYLRSVHLNRAQHACLAPLSTMERDDTHFTALQASLSSADTEQAARAGIAVIETLTGLLAGLIGLPLTMRLLTTAWANAAEGKPL